MSAPSPMCRTAILILALAACFVPSAIADMPVSTANPHRRAVDRGVRDLRAHRAPAARRSAASERRVSARRSAHHTPSRVSSRALSRRDALREPRSEHSRAAADRRLAEERADHRRLSREEARRAREWKTERDRREAEARASRQPVRSLRRPTATGELAARPEEETGAAEARIARSEDRTMREAAAPAPDEEENTTSTTESAETPVASKDDQGAMNEPAWLTRGGMPPPLRGSLALLERQDERLEADGLERIEDEADLSARIENHLLVPLPASDALTVNAELPLHHRYCRPWTARFLTDLARAHEAEFHRPLEVSSAVRTVAYQARLMRINGNAAPAVGDIFSPHLMGATVDIAKKEMSRDEIAWMRRRLLALELTGKIDVEEEFEQACFHITVYRSYAPGLSGRPLNHYSPAASMEKAAAAGMM